MNESPRVPEEDRPLISVAFFIAGLCLLLAWTLVGELDEVAPGDRPSTIVVGAALAVGGALGWITPTGRLDDGKSGRGKAISGALLITSGSVALVGLRDEFPSGPLLAMAIAIGWCGVTAPRLVVQYFRERRTRE